MLVSSPKIKQQAYFSLVRPLLEYSSTVWDPSTQENINKLEKVQRRAARWTLSRFHNTSSVSSMLDILSWRPLYLRRTDNKLCLFFKIVHNIVSIPSEKYLTPITRTSRLHHGNAFQIPHSSKDYHLYSFFPSTIRIWNKLPSQIASLENFDAFKSAIQNIEHQPMLSA